MKIASIELWGNIHDFFIQLKRVTLHKAINFTIPLDTLSIKIERILRDMLYLNGYSTMKQLPNGKEQMFLLDDILKSEVFICRNYSFGS